jgi:hypothetical protein
MAIDIGTAAIDRGSAFPAGYTVLQLDNPANAAGVITSVELWFATDTSNIKVGTFYGSGSYTMRDSVDIGAVVSGAKRTFTGLSIDVEIGDVIGFYYPDGSLENDSGVGGTQKYANANYFDGTEHIYLEASQIASIYGTGIEPGWGHKIMGISPGKVMGVAKANIAKIMGK